MLRFIKLFEILLSGKIEFVIPLLAEPSNEGFAEELIGSDAKFATERLGRAADFPAMQIDRREAVILLEAHRVEAARDRFDGRDFSGASSLLEGTETHAIGGVSAIDAIAPLDDLRNEIAIRVCVRGAILGDSASSGRSDEIFHLREDLGDSLILARGERGARIALDAASTETGIEIADKETLNEIERDESILNL